MSLFNIQTWQDIHWQEVTEDVRQVQAAIVKAERAGNQREVFTLQDQLVRSQPARLLAVKQVTSNNGRHTPGVDGEIWDTPEQKLHAAENLTFDNYRAKPARRVYIPKGNGKTRPIGILTMRDRAMQALFLLALDPIAETRADPHSYGFRKHRCTADAIMHCAELFAEKDSPQWILEADIEECFDSISHNWLLRHIPLPKPVLRSWLKAGYVEKGRFRHMRRGLPQGGIISPTLVNMALDGMESMLITYFHHSPERQQRSKIAFVRYADDFIVAGSGKKLLREDVKSLLTNFLKKRGMRFSVRKTTITHISEGFDFLGYHIITQNPVFGEYAVKITPAQKSVQHVLRRIDKTLAELRDADPEQVIQKLNPVIQGWTRYYTFGESQDIFAYLDQEIYRRLRKWAKRRHPSLWHRKQVNACFANVDGMTPVFTDAQGQHLLCARQTPLLSYTPVKAEFHAYDPAWEAYLVKRQAQPKPAGTYSVINMV